MKKLLLGTLLLSSIIFLPSCKKNDLKIKDIPISSEQEFGGIYIKKTIDEFNDLGYEFGDSISISFSNGKTLKDLPYYNGYYVDAGEKLLVGYPGYDYIKAAINYGDDLFEVLDLKETDTATIKLNKKGKYKDIQVASDIHYYDERERYTSDTIFANFRAMNVGNLKADYVFRSASPCNNEHKRASYTDKLMEEANISFIMNLADTKEKIDKYISQDDFNSPYFLSLYNNNKLCMPNFDNEETTTLKLFNSEESVVPLAMNMNYTSKEFAQKIALGFKSILSSDGPILIHCLEGKDRTGFVCIVLEVLMEASYTEIVDDYMLTYDNYYGIDKNDSRYEIIKKRNVDSMLKFICKDNDYKEGNISNYAKDYLIYGGMTEAEVKELKDKLHA